MSDLEPDLVSPNISYIEFSGRLRLGRDRIRRIMHEEKTGKERVLILANPYRSEGKDHFASAIAHPVLRKPDILRLQVTFSRRSALEFEHEEAKPVRYLFDLIAKDRIETTLRCSLFFHYPSASWDSSIILPLMPFDIPSMPFDEIRGFRAVKLADDRKTKYSIVVDRPESKDYHHAVTFSFVASFDHEVVASLLKEGISISRQFVRPHERTRRRQ